MARNSDWIERNLYDAGGHTGNTYYTRIVRRSDGYVWNPTTLLMVAVTTANWEDTITFLEEVSESGVFPIVIPRDWRKERDVALELYGKLYPDLTAAQKVLVDAEFQSISNIPGGTYDIIVYKQLGSNPVNTDDVEKQFETKLGGDIFGF